jgi:NAD(P)-dependent dehydrogenase (short-subunit alcohol dehydrogenase family)
MDPFGIHTAQIALVTGAGRGLGRALALRLAEKGLIVGALGRKVADLESLAAEAVHGRIVPLIADVANVKSLAQAFEALDRKAGPVDTLINNAAVYPHRDFLDETPESFMATVNVNLGGIVAASSLALERMVPRGTGRIVNVATFAGNAPTYLASAYSVSKGAARILTQAMVRDLGDRFPDIVITDWIPGVLRTDMGLPDGIEPAVSARWGAALALWHDPTLNGALFVEQDEHLPVTSFRRQIFDKLTGRGSKPRRIVV